MNSTLLEIEKAAEAVQANSTSLTTRFDYIDALKEPATVLELVRLARVGQQTLDRLDKQTERLGPFGNKNARGLADE